MIMHRKDEVGLWAELKIGVAKAQNILAQWQRPEGTTPWVNE